MRRSSNFAQEDDDDIQASEIVPETFSQPEPSSEDEKMETETTKQEPGKSGAGVESEKSKTGKGGGSEASYQDNEDLETEEDTKPTTRRGRPRKSVASRKLSEPQKSDPVSENQDDEEMDVLPEIVKATPSRRGRKSLAATVHENVGTAEDNAQATPSRRGRKSLAATYEQESSEPEIATPSRRGRRSLAVEALSTAETKISTPSRRGRKSLAVCDPEPSSVTGTPSKLARSSKITFEEATFVGTPSADERVSKSGLKKTRGRKSNLMSFSTPPEIAVPVTTTTSSKKISRRQSLAVSALDSSFGNSNAILATPVTPVRSVPAGTTPRRSSRKSMLLTPFRK